SHLGSAGVHARCSFALLRRRRRRGGGRRRPRPPMGDDPSDFGTCGGKRRTANPDAARDALERLAAVTAAAVERGAAEARERVAAAASGPAEPGEVVRLDLSTVQLYPAGAAELVSAMAGDPGCPVQALNVCNTRLGNQGGLEVARLLEAGHPPLLELDLQMNKLGDAAAEPSAPRCARTRP
ncbi:unnamed protein product, partial [Prorocentrum cordatum]